MDSIIFSRDRLNSPGVKMNVILIGAVMICLIAAVFSRGLNRVVLVLLAVAIVELKSLP